ncbi:MAG TPA: BolA/IbaG family iron-sulfur metabolism protein [Alcanivoracaceae bacterium]|nr:BolA/IbaG family iron-sulfur metabolism protein [Alcanivoracaceae bacterium]
MSSVAETIEQRIRQNFEVFYFDLLNESHQHSGPATESHFKLTLVADEFNGLMLVKRHQKIYQLVQDLLDGPVHAFSMHLFTREEWEKRGGEVAPSPQCRGAN